MIDTHSHFLYNIDDGSRSEEMTLKMLKQAQDVGITALLATPHINYAVNQDYIEQIEKTFVDTQKLCSVERIDIHLYLGSELMYEVDFSKYNDVPFRTIGTNKKYLLFELPVYFDFDKISQLIFDLMLSGTIPILAHPERMRRIREKAHYLVKWINQGCLMQLNAGSIVGQFGKDTKEFSHRMLKSNMIHIVASDAHEHKHRNYKILRDAYHIVSDNYDTNRAEKLFNKNPGNMIKGNKIETFTVMEEIFYKKENSMLSKFLNIFK